MLDLDAAVQLEEVELAAVEDELRGARAAVADGLGEANGRVAHPRTELRVERGGGRLLQHLLVSPLDGALALPEGEHRPVAVCEQLDLHVARPLEVALDEDRVVAERRLRLAAGGLERVVELGRAADDAHAAPAAARRGLHEQRETDLLRLAVRNDRDARGASDPLGGELVPARAQRLGRRPDPREARRLDRLGEVAVLRQEAVAGMDRVRAGPLRRTDQLLGIEIAPDRDRLVCGARVQRACVVLGGDGDRADAERLRGAEDPERDLAAVRYEERVDRHRPARVSAQTPESMR